ncbi:MAG: hypothetical protein PHI63_05750 [Patescibacteria group bacterium]|nr:hypothetical protein [Patescibacteria group bacterium]
MPDSVYNPFTDAEEVLFKDADGQLKVARKDSVEPWHPSESAALDAEAFLLVAPRAPDPLEMLADRVVAELKLAMPDEVLRKRLRNTVLSRLKDVRDQIETRETLTRPTKVGGLGLPPEVTENVLKIIERYVQQHDDRERNLIDQAIKEIEASVGMPLPSTDAPDPGAPAQATAAPAILAQQGNYTPSRPPVTVPPPAPAPSRGSPPPSSFRLTPLPAVSSPAVPPLPPYRVPPVAPPRPSPSPVQSRPAVAAAQPRPMAAPAPVPWVERPGEQPRPAKLPVAPPPREPLPLPRTPTVSAPVTPPPSAPVSPVEPALPAPPPVRPRTKLVGPLEELREMTLVDFRRLDEDAAKATSRIQEKIAILEQQSFGHKAAAIAAWRSSEVFKRYTELAAAAMGEKKPVGDVMKSMQSAGREVLTVAEFEAIADFNRTLRY